MKISIKLDTEDYVGAGSMNTLANALSLLVEAAAQGGSRAARLPRPKPEPVAEAAPEPEAKPKAKPEAKPKAKPEAKPKAKPEAKPKAKPKAKPRPAEEAAPVSEDDLRDACFEAKLRVDAAGGDGTRAARAVLGEYGAERAPGVPEDKRAECVAKLEKLGRAAA